MSLFLNFWAAARLRSGLLLSTAAILVSAQLPPTLQAQNVPAAPAPQ